MRKLILTLIFVAFLAPVKADPRPEWLTDLVQVYTKSCVDLCILTNEDLGSSLSVKEITRFARAFSSKEWLEEALKVLPTEERRDRARKTLTPFTIWGTPVWDGTDSHMAHP